MRMASALAVGALGFALLVSGASAATYYVSTNGNDTTGLDWANAFTTVQRALSAAVSDDTIYLAGQIGAPGADITTQTRAVLAEIDDLLARAGSDKHHILMATIWLADIADFDAMNAVWDSWVSPTAPPARATSARRLKGRPVMVSATCAPMTLATLACSSGGRAPGHPIRISNRSSRSRRERGGVSTSNDSAAR